MLRCCPQLSTTQMLAMGSFHRKSAPVTGTRGILDQHCSKRRRIKNHPCVSFFRLDMVVQRILKSCHALNLEQEEWCVRNNKCCVIS